MLPVFRLVVRNWFEIGSKFIRNTFVIDSNDVCSAAYRPLGQFDSSPNTFWTSASDDQTHSVNLRSDQRTHYHLQFILISNAEQQNDGTAAF